MAGRGARKGRFIRLKLSCFLCELIAASVSPQPRRSVPSELARSVPPLSPSLQPPSPSSPTLFYPCPGCFSSPVLVYTIVFVAPLSLLAAHSFSRLNSNYLLAALPFEHDSEGVEGISTPDDFRGRVVKSRRSEQRFGDIFYLEFGGDIVAGNVVRTRATFNRFS